MSSFHTALLETKIRHLNLPSPTTIGPSTTVEEAIKHMRGVRCACALVVEDGKLVGILTERDVLNKVIGQAELLERPVRELMTPNPVTLTTDHSLDDAIHLMSEGGYRNVPIVDKEGRPIASLPASEIVKFIVAHFPRDIYNLPPRLEQHMATPEGA